MTSVSYSYQGNPAGQKSRTQSSPPALAWLWLGLLAAVVALFGGSSRPDPVQIAVVRPLAALLLIPALYHLRLSDLGRVKALAVLLGLTIVWMLIQLVPLPPGLWQGLPDRAGIAELDQLTRNPGLWRPISLTPMRGLNAALSMVVPVAALLIAVSMRASGRTLLFCILAIGVVDAAFGLLQVLGGAQSPFYLFSITSRGFPAGIFANENHSALFSALTLLVIGRLGLESRSVYEPAWLRLAYAPIFLFVLLSILVSGSRAGLAAGVVVLLAVGLMAFLKTRREKRRINASSHVPRVKGSGLLFAGLAISALGLVALAFVWLGKTPAFEDILARNAFEDLRWLLLPVLGQMVSQHWLAGSGFGSFDVVYHIYEPTELLLSAYVNHAHNDWAQLIIEGGLPAIVLLAAGLGWAMRTIWVVAKMPEETPDKTIFWVICFAILAAASIVDYPLRTPVFQVTLVWLLTVLALELEPPRVPWGAFQRLIERI